jgi:hypothetical protein
MNTKSVPRSAKLTLVVRIDGSVAKRCVGLLQTINGERGDYGFNPSVIGRIRDNDTLTVEFPLEFHGLENVDERLDGFLRLMDEPGSIFWMEANGTLGDVVSKITSERPVVIARTDERKPGLLSRIKSFFRDQMS